MLILLYVLHNIRNEHTLAGTCDAESQAIVIQRVSVFFKFGRGEGAYVQRIPEIPIAEALQIDTVVQRMIQRRIRTAERLDRRQTPRR